MNLSSFHDAIETGKMVAQKEIAAAQDSLLNGKMGACGSHLDKAMRATMGK